MCLRSLGFILILFPGVLQAQRAAQGCDAPRLAHGNFLPKQETYSHGATITYACDNGYKPVVEGWWATSTCQHGRWSHEPQCMEESACLPPTIPNAEYRENSNGWYESGSTLRITCDEGFEHKNQNTTTTCENGNWSPLPVCEPSSDEREATLRYIPIDSCGAPPVIRNGVVTETTRFYLKYQCQSLYKLVGADTVKCVSRDMWSDLPECRASFCAVNTDDNPEYISIGTVYIKHGEEQRVECVKPHSQSFKHYSVVRCYNDGRVQATKCCNRAEHAMPFLC